MADNKRQEILRSVLAVLGEVGLEGFSASALAARAGVSKANLYHHFSSMDDIVLEAFEQFALGMVNLAPPKDMTLRQWLLGVGAAALGDNSEEAALGKAYFVFTARALFDEKLRTRMGQTAQMASDSICEIIRRMPGNKLTPEQAVALGDLVFITADGMAIHKLVFPERSDAIGAAWANFVEHIAPSLPQENGE